MHATYPAHVNLLDYRARSVIYQAPPYTIKVARHYGMAHPQGADGGGVLPICRVAANIRVFYKQSMSADESSSFSLVGILLRKYVGSVAQIQ
jgi:hypothetical protein